MSAEKEQPKLSILVVEDEPLQREIMSEHLAGHTVDFAHDKETARQKLEAAPRDICFVDLKLGQKDHCSGLDLIPLAAAKKIYTVVMSSLRTDRHVDRAYDLGCDDFFSKGNVASSVSEVLAKYRQKRETTVNSGLFEDEFITQDPETRSTVTAALEYAGTDLPVMILGPSGSGKTHLARVFHNRSGRRGQYIAINCSSYTEETLEAELFGSKKGAFTGATHMRGKLLMADHGTLFLDEIGSMSLAMQTKLLKAIEEKTFFPLGSDRPESSDFRIITATWEDVQRLIKTGKMRFDFFQRIHGVKVDIKPLSRRKSDIFPLISRFTRDGRQLSFSADARDVVLGHDWPGNVRELEKFVKFLAKGNEGRVSAEAASDLINMLAIEEERNFVTEWQRAYALRHGLRAAMRRFVDAVIDHTMESNNGAKTKTMSDLQIDTRLFYNSCKRRGETPKENARP